MKELVIATHNPAKISEYRTGLKDLEKQGILLATSTELGIRDEPKETGRTFKENALLKAQFYAKLSGKPAVSDDGGLTIDALNGAPGVYSRRWMGFEASDDELIQYTIKRMEEVAGDNRSAAMELVVCFFDPHTQTALYGSGKIQGYIADEPSEERQEGFPYRALLKILPFDKYYHELSSDEHAQLNHRLRALKELAPQIVTFFQ